MNILVTGGAGYIGSHTALGLLAQNHEVIILDNLSNSSAKVIPRLEKISGKKIQFYEGDLCDKSFTRQVFAENEIDAVIHFAGLKSVGESVSDPLSYYRNNIDSTLTLCEVMKDAGVRKLIFSSSATVYGDPEELPLKESSRTGEGILNAYGRTKYMIELILQDLVVSDPTWQITALRYFNPIGAHESGLIGEDPNGTPNNLLPYVAQVAVGKRDHINVFGDDYDTVDGTGVRDYIHVLDLASGHVAALEHLSANNQVDIYNLGTGTGVSVFEMIHAFEKACGKTLPYKVIERRPGDTATSYADVSKAKAKLGWQAVKTLDDACADSWRWQQQNPNGYTDV
jgi:UDP-glucose 4-epimerase